MFARSPARLHLRLKKAARQTGGRPPATWSTAASNGEDVGGGDGDGLSTVVVDVL